MLYLKSFLLDNKFKYLCFIAGLQTGNIYALCQSGIIIRANRLNRLAQRSGHRINSKAGILLVNQYLAVDDTIGYRIFRLFHMTDSHRIAFNTPGNSRQQDSFSLIGKGIVSIGHEEAYASTRSHNAGGQFGSFFNDKNQRLITGTFDRRSVPQARTVPAVTSSIPT